jgi:hypothetical protein
MDQNFQQQNFKVQFHVNVSAYGAVSELFVPKIMDAVIPLWFVTVSFVAFKNRPETGEFEDPDWSHLSCHQRSTRLLRRGHTYINIQQRLMVASKTIHTISLAI